MRLRRRAGLLVLLIYLMACLGDESSGPRPIPSALQIAAGGIQTGVVAQPLDTALTVRVLDQHGEAMAGVLVQFVIADTAGSLSSLTRTTGPDGLAATVWTLPQAAASYAVLARVAELDSVTFQAEAGPAAASQLLVVAGDSQWTTVGQPLDSVVRVRLADPFGNPVPGQAVSFLVLAGGGTIPAPSAVTDSVGFAETRWTLGAAPAVGKLLVSVISVPPVVAEAYAFPVQRPDSLSFGPATCHLPAAGGLRCWGPGASLPLGTGDTTTAFTPVSIPTAQDFVSLHGGNAATCGLTAEGTAWCWGTTIGLSSGIPVELTPGQQWRQVVVGSGFLCGVSTAYLGYCWGNPGALGNGSTVFQPTPTLIAGGHHWLQIAAGYGYACGVNTRAMVYCWGGNLYGVLGNGILHPDAPRPVAIQSTERFQAVSTGPYHACALTLDGRVFCWGYDEYGSTGTGGGLPKPVDNTLHFSSIRTAEGGACGITSSGETLCWGNNGLGILGLAPQFAQLFVRPTRIQGDPGLTQLAVREDSVCGKDGAGEIWCWGSNAQGNIGVGDTRRELAPDAVIGAPTFKMVVTGAYHACGLTVQGEAWCWGESWYLGRLDSVASVLPIRVDGGLTFTTLSLGRSLTCGLTAAGAAHCWGFGAGGRRFFLPTPLLGNDSFSAVSAGDDHVCGITLAGPTVCAGRNYQGQLGDSSLTEHLTPVVVTGGHLFSQLVAGNYATCGLDSLGAAFCWGQGPLGDGTSGPRSYPGPVSGGHTFQSLAAPSNGVTCGITTSGDAWCWGLSVSGRYGNGSSSASQPVPAPVSGGHKFAQIEVGDAATCGVTTSGTPLCWGINTWAALGTGDTVSSALPVAVSGNLRVTHMSSGFATCAVEQAGATFCWGENARGILGNGESGIIPAPSRVP